VTAFSTQTGQATVTTTSTSVDVTSTTTTATVTSQAEVVNKRAAVPTVPVYASMCSGAVAYSSACSCIGVVSLTVTAPTPSTTITVSGTSTTVATATATATTTELSTAVVTETSTAPAMTVVTSCPSQPTWSPQDCLVGLPIYCLRLEQFSGTIGDAQRLTLLDACRAAISDFPTLLSKVGSCFPANVYDPIVYRAPAKTVTDCIRAANIMCQFSSPSCYTRTYPVGQVPTDVSSYPVEALVNGGFEMGDITGFVYQPNIDANANLPLGVTTTRPHSGSYSLESFFNDNIGQGAGFSIGPFSVVPNATYTFSLWFYQTNSGAMCTFSKILMPNQAYPGGYFENDFLNVPANQWNKLTWTVKTTASIAYIRGVPACNTGPAPYGDPTYQNKMWFDDFSFKLER
jgi:hypothetical protein